MSEKVEITKSKLDDLADAIAQRADVSTCMTISGMQSAVSTMYNSGEYNEMRNGLLFKTYSDSINMPSASSVIPYMFYGFSKIQSISFPDAVSVGSYAFYGCKSLSDVNLDSAIEIGSYAFKECSKLSHISLGSATKIGSGAFEGLTKLTLSNSTISYAGDSAFYGCKSIGSEAFLHNGALKSFGNYAFANCSALTSIVVDGALQANGAFQYCESLESVSFGSTTMTREGETWTFYTSRIYSSTFQNCYNLSSLSLGVDSLGSDVKIRYVGEYAFYWCTRLDFGNLLGELRYAGDYAFESTGVASVDFASDLSYIGRRAFVGCSSLSRIGMSSHQYSVQIGQQAFDGCSAMTEASFPDCITDVGAYAFRSCFNLSSINLTGCKTIGSSAFFSCKKLEGEISIPLCSEIGGYAFGGCSKITAAYMPQITYLAPGTFSGCQLLSEVHFSNVSYVGRSAFTGCWGLKELSFPYGQPCSLYSWAFAYCTSMSRVILPSIYNIQSSTFTGCTNLMSVYLLYRSTSLVLLSSSNAFSETKIKSQGTIYVPSSMYSSYLTAPQWSYFASRFVSMTDTEIDEFLGIDVEVPAEGVSF